VKTYLQCMTSTPNVDRTLHLLDVENLTSSCNCTVERVSATASEYLDLFPSTQKDLFVLATSVKNALPGWFGWPTSAQRLMQSGENGADLALIEAYRFQRVVIGSGDGIFTELATQLIDLGCFVTVVSRPKCLSRRLSLAVQSVLFLSEIEDGMEGIRAA
jgi:hypothetical protein